MMIEDAELLRRYACGRDEAAFRELVERHLGLVFYAAVRLCGGDTHRAQDVAQSVFADLARKADQLSRHRSLAGWLHTSTRYAAAQARRTESRRQAREHAAMIMNELVSDTAGRPTEWERLRPVIDETLHALPDRQREAVLLRFFEQHSFAEVGRRLSLSEDAARMHVARAVEKLRVILAKKGIDSTAGALTLLLLNQAGAAAPAGLAANISGAVLAGGGAGMAAGFLGFMSATKIVTAIALVGVTAVVVGYRTLRESNPNQQQTALQVKLAGVELKLATATARANAADADNATLLEAIRAARPKAGDAKGGDDWMTSDRLEYRGSSTPRQAFETFYWAQFKGDAKAMSETIVLPPKVRAEVDDLLQLLPPARRMKFTSADHFAASLLVGSTPGINQTMQLTREDSGATLTPTGFSVAEVYGLGAEAARDPTYSTIICKYALKNGGHSESFALFQQTSSGWRYVIPPTKFLTALWKRREQTASNANP